jgi:hypothetical protein
LFTTAGGLAHREGSLICLNGGGFALRPAAPDHGYRELTAAAGAVLGESVTAMMLAGIALVLAGVALTRYHAKSSTPH